MYINNKEICSGESMGNGDFSMGYGGWGQWDIEDGLKFEWKVYIIQEL